ncbi:MAG: helix-turn-helix transcriptional regulator [Dehalococcoidia bacterium]|nr:helix-turn-helix transcriptional regulator [Dehalococcoidia bacterium]
MSDISDRLLAAVKNAGYTYRELSRMTKIPASAIQRYAMGETNKIPVDRLERIASATGVRAEYLLGWDTTVRNEPMSEVDRLRDELRHSPERKALLSATKNLSADAVRKITEMIKSFPDPHTT